MTDCPHEMKKELDEFTDFSAALSRKVQPIVRQYHRPKTRGELRAKLKEGVLCEVVASNTSITSHMLAWMDLWENIDYTVRGSENKGWDVFVPNDKLSFEKE